MSASDPATIRDSAEVDTLSGRPSFTLQFRLRRLAWMVTWRLLGAWTPRPWFAWRRLLLRAFGAEMTTTSRVYGSARIWWPGNLAMGTSSSVGPRVNLYSMGRITIGNDVVISQDAHLCAGTHDYNDPRFQLRAIPVTVGNQVWIAAEAFVSPGTIIGDGVVLGARAVASGKLDPWMVYSGNPATPVKPRRLSA